MKNKYIGIFLLGFMAWDSAQAQMGIGITTPLVSLDIQGENSFALSTGSQVNGTLRLKKSTGNNVFDMGSGQVSGEPVFWMQARESNDYSVSRPLLLQPVGGKMAIGGLPLTETLGVTGDVFATGSIRGSAAGSVLHMVSLEESSLSLTAAVQTSSTSRTDLFSVTYTPVSSQSDIWVEVVGNASINGGGGDKWRTNLVVGGLDIQTRDLICENNSGGGGRGTTLFPLSGIYENSSTNSITIKVDAIRLIGDDTLTLQPDVTLLITEIAR